MATLIGVDVGGTFTDFFALDDDGSVRTWKRLSSRAAPEHAVLEGLAGESAASIIHGSTVATNSLLERKGPRTALLVTKGFADILEIRRQVRPAIYDLMPRRTPHVVHRSDILEVDERLDPEGNAVVPLTDVEVERVVAACEASGAMAFAVCLLYGYRYTACEMRIAEALRSRGFDVSVAHEVLPEHREYERASTTAVNAFLRPATRTYLGNLAGALPGLRVIQSSGGVAPAAHSAELPVSMVTSGPAGGVLGALAVARAAGYDDIIAFDMGGTSTDVSICPGGRPLYRSVAEIDGIAVHTPMIDIITVGAGGGSIARLDPGGALRVGPESAGADPGPACYGRGEQPTVSDANAVLGRLRQEQPLAGSLVIDSARARAAIDTLGPADAIARSVVEVVNANMATALRRVSLERGFDPALFTLVAFGGSGPLHCCELAAEVGIPRVLVPRHPGVLSALGMVTAPLALEVSVPAPSEETSTAADTLRSTAGTRAATSGWTRAEVSAAEELWAADVRYRGQGHELRVALDSAPVSREAVAQAFHAAHEQRFGYADAARDVDVVNIRLRLEHTRDVPAVMASAGAATSGAATGTRAEADGEPLTLHERASLQSGNAFSGPAIVMQIDATTYIPPGWAVRVDAFENLVLEQRP